MVDGDTIFRWRNIIIKETSPGINKLQISTESVNYYNKQETHRENLDDAWVPAFHLSYTPLTQNFMAQ